TRRSSDLRIANLGKGQRADRIDTAIAVSQEQAADHLNVSVDSIQRAKKVRESGVPELAAMVESGELAVSTAAVIAEIEPERQREVISVDDEKEIIRRANEIKRAKREQKRQEWEAKRREARALGALAGEPEIRRGDFADVLADLEDGSV